MGIRDSITNAAFGSVVSSYAHVTGNRFFKVKPSPKVEESCREFVRIAFMLGVTPTILMEEAVAMYGSAWCQETFHTKFPPFYVVTGEKCRKRLVHNHRPKVSQTKEALEKQGLEIARNLTDLMGKEKALGLVAGGWPEDERLRAVVLNSIRRV